MPHLHGEIVGQRVELEIDGGKQEHIVRQKLQIGQERFAVLERGETGEGTILRIVEGPDHSIYLLDIDDEQEWNVVQSVYREEFGRAA